MTGIAFQSSGILFCEFFIMIKIREGMRALCCSIVSSEGMSHITSGFCLVLVALSADNL